MKAKLVFRSMPKMRQGRNRMAKAMKLLPLLLAGGLMSAPAHGECYRWVDLSGYNFSSFSGGHVSCEPSPVASRTAWNSDGELRLAYEEMWEECRSSVNSEWNCPVVWKWNNVNQVRSTWQREVSACQQRMTNQYRKYKGKMCW